MKVRSLEELEDRVLALYESTIEECYAGPRNEDKESWEEIEGRIRGVVRAIVGSRHIEQKGKLGPNDLVFETDLHGDLVAFLNTVLSTGLVKFNEDNPLGIVFYDPLTDQEYDLHTFEKHVASLGRDRSIELMRRIQLLPDVAPTEDFGKYINCGDILDRGQQSEQLLYLIRRLCGGYSKKYPENSAPTIIIGNHEGLLIIPDYDNSLTVALISAGGKNGANHIFSSIKYIYGYCCDSDIKKQNCALKFRDMGMAVRTAIDSGEFTLAHRVGKTIFTHAVITVGMIENLSKRFNTLAEALENASGWDSRGDQTLKKEIQVLAKNLDLLAKRVSYPRDLSESEIDNLVDTLNKFNVARAKLIERRGRIAGVEEETNPLLPGEYGIVKIMNQGIDDDITWLRKRFTSNSTKLPPGVKFVLGHDPDPEEHRKWNPGMISYIDSYVSSGYNEGTTRANYFVADRSIFDSEGPFSEKRAPHIVSEDITPAMLEERARATV
ncbi:MAG: hypothetical protein LBB24_01220, partial [Rickettsiales bacterium]|nr:hypothetical protein [Rickettsiales bacterium]